MSELLTRRQVMRSASLAALASFLAPALRAGEFLRSVSPTRVLVLLELEGGNDGLNTVVPYGDATYAIKRPDIQLTVGNSDERKRVIPFSTFSAAGQSSGFKPTGMGIHAKLAPLQGIWQAGDMAIVQGLGYENPNRSHFRGIDIWNDAMTDDQSIPQDGWLGRMFTAEGAIPGSTTDGILFNRANNNPLRASGIKSLSMSLPSDFISRTNGMVDPSDAQLLTTNPALKHVLTVQRQARQARANIQTAVGTAPTFATTFPNNGLGNQAKYVAQCIAGGLQCPFYKISIGGFDNHTSQVNKHADLMDQVAKALAALRDALVEKGAWDRVMIVTYSEFGRRVEENGSDGTDHGTAAPHFVLGGKVKGGFYGSQPSLTDLDSRGDLKFNTDFRRLYSACGLWLGVTQPHVTSSLPPKSGDPDFTALDCIDLA